MFLHVGYAEQARNSFPHLLVLMTIGLFVPFVYLKPYAELKGISPGTAATLVSALGVGSLLGRLLLGAIAVAAQTACRETLTGSFLSDNRAMRALFKKAGAHFERGEPGVSEARLAVTDAVELVDTPTVAALTSAVTDIVNAGGLALAETMVDPWAEGHNDSRDS